MVRMKLTPLGSVPLGVRVIRLVRPFDGVSHTLHDGHNLNRLDIEVVFRNTGAIYLFGQALA